MAHQLTMKKDAAVIGGVNMDIWGRPSDELVDRDSAPGRVTMSPGGVGRNIAHDMCLLGMDVSLVAALGDDSNGKALLEQCSAVGLDMALCPVIPGRNSSSYLYITDKDGELKLAINEMDICREISPEYLESILPRLNGFSALVIDANLSQEAIAFICENIRVPIYADPVSTVKGKKLLPYLGRLRAFKPNMLEAQALTGETDPERAAKAFINMGVQRVFISLGSEGMLAASREELLHVPSMVTEVVNVTGAGDSAMAAIVWADTQGMSLADTVRASQLAGCITCRSELSNAPELSTLPEIM